MPGTFTQPGPTVTGTRVTVDTYLRQSPLIQRDLENLTYQRFIADFIYRQGQRTQSGAVMYEQLLANDLFVNRDLKQIDELSEFPIVNTPEKAPQTAQVAKWGAAVLFSYEKIRRDARDLLQRDLRKLANTMVRKVNRIAIAVLRADAEVQTYTTTAGTWDGVSEKIQDLATAASMVDNIDLGYSADTVLINPTNALELKIDDAVTNRLPRETNNPILSRDLAGLLNLDFVESNDQTLDELVVLSRGMIGSYHDELPMYSRVIDQPEHEGRLLQAARVTVPIVTDPKAAVLVDGI